MRKRHKRENGYSLVELLVATILFTIIAGSVFSLLLSAQLRYRGESNVTTAFQQANVAIDQITRDVHSAGYPPPSSFPGPPALPPDPSLVALPFSWSLGSGYPNPPCTVNGSCGAVPGDYDLILETDLSDSNGVQWIRYSLQGTTLMRGVTSKIKWADPVASTSAGAGVLLPYLDNVINQSKSRPVFSYCYDRTGCAVLTAPTGLVSDIREVNVTLIVQSAQPDPQTHELRTITLTGQAARFN